jgi:aspartyl-tRNA synthetase
MRTTYCGLVSEALMGQTVTLMGWVNRRRDHGGVIFVDLRDREGLCAGRLRPRPPRDVRPPRACATSSASRSRAWCGRAPKAPTNDNLKSGKIEVLCHELKVLNPSASRRRSSWTTTT